MKTAEQRARLCVPTDDHPDYVANESDIAAQIRGAVEEFAREAAAKLRERALMFDGDWRQALEEDGVDIVESLARPAEKSNG